MVSQTWKFGKALRPFFIDPVENCFSSAVHRCEHLKLHMNKHNKINLLCCIALLLPCLAA